KCTRRRSDPRVANRYAPNVKNRQKVKTKKGIITASIRELMALVAERNQPRSNTKHGHSISAALLRVVSCGFVVHVFHQSLGKRSIDLPDLTFPRRKRVAVACRTSSGVRRSAVARLWG